MYFSPRTICCPAAPAALRFTHSPTTWYLWRLRRHQFFFCGAFGATGEGCLNTSGTGATLTASGDANTAADSFSLAVAGAPANKPGIFFQGTNQLNNPVGDGILCSNSSLRYDVNFTDANGETSQTGFGANATAGGSLNYQYWFRDPANACGAGGFNFTNGWAVTWN